MFKNVHKRENMIKTIEKDNKQIIIIGTAHISKKNKEQVRETILIEKPEVVCVELDRDRYFSIMKGDGKREVKFSDIFRSRKPMQFLTYYVLAKYQNKIAKDFNITPGEEMTEAINTAKEVGAKVLLADRNINITMAKLNKALTFREKFRILGTGFKMRKELGENIDVQSLLSETENENGESPKIKKIMDILERRHKKLKDALINERDEFIAYNIQQALLDPLVNKVVVVVGAGHMDGIISNLDNKEINLRKILTVNYKEKKDDKQQKDKK